MTNSRKWFQGIEVIWVGKLINLQIGQIDQLDGGLQNGTPRQDTVVPISRIGWVVP